MESQPILWIYDEATFLGDPKSERRRQIERWLKTAQSPPWRAMVIHPVEEPKQELFVELPCLALIHTNNDQQFAFFNALRDRGDVAVLWYSGGNLGLRRKDLRGWPEVSPQSVDDALDDILRNWSNIRPGASRKEYLVSALEGHHFRESTLQALSVFQAFAWALEARDGDLDAAADDLYDEAKRGTALVGLENEIARSLCEWISDLTGPGEPAKEDSPPHGSVAGRPVTAHDFCREIKKFGPLKSAADWRQAIATVRDAWLTTPNSPPPSCRSESPASAGLSADHFRALTRRPIR